MKVLKRIVIIESILLVIIIPFTLMLYLRYIETKQVVERLINFVINEFNNLGKGIYEFIFELKTMYPSISEIFTNREAAVGFLIILLIIYMVSMKKTRKSLLDLIKIFFSRQFFRMNSIMIIYMIVILMVLIKIGFWELALLKTTIIWFISTGLISVYKAIGSAKDFNYFTNLIKESIKIVIAIEFVTNLYSFSFFKEVVLILSVLFLSMLIAIIDVKPEFKGDNYKKIKNFFYVIIIVIAFYWLYNSIKLLIDDLPNIDISLLVKELILPSIFSISFIIIMYFMVIYSMYEVMFIRIGFKKIINDKIRPYLRFRILVFCNINIVRIHNFIQKSGVLTTYINTKQDIKQIIKNYKY